MCFFIVERQSVANSSQLCDCWSTRSLLAATSLIRWLMSVLCLLCPRFVIFWRDKKWKAGLSKNYICLQVDNFAFGLLIAQHLPADNRARGTLLKVCFWKVVAVAPLSYCRLSSARLAAVSRPVLSSALCIRALFRNEPLCTGIMWDIWAFAYASTAKVKACAPPPTQPPAPFITREHRPQLSSHNKPSLRGRWGEVGVFS